MPRSHLDWLESESITILRELAAECRKPVLLKRGMSATVKDLLLSAEYVLSEGNLNVVLCERGVRTFEDSTRNMIDLAAIPNVQGQSHLPIIADPSHATGIANLVLPAARSSIAAGADGLIVEFHPNPVESLSDADQALPLDSLGYFTDEIRKLANVFGREVI